MDFINILKKKRDGFELQKEEISALIQQLVDGVISDSQIGAFLMAVYIQDLNDAETVNLTQSMVLSGRQLQWDMPEPLVDKHSTGGVGDKISLILAPIMAACGMKVPMISGRTLEHTGGTLDKLETIPGFKVDLDAKEQQHALEVAGCFIVAAASDLCPADQLLYKIRDVTATVDNLNLIVASIISKKVVSGIEFLVVDVKVGRAAFCKTIESARLLAKKLISVSAQLRVSTCVVLSRMDEPLGNNVGNTLEVLETVQCLKGVMPKDIAHLVTALGSKLLEMANCKENPHSLIANVIKDGSAMKCFQSMLEAQGVKHELASKLCFGEPVLQTAKHTTNFKSTQTGWVSEVNALTIGKVCQVLGAGRFIPTDIIDATVGMILCSHVGDTIEKGDVWLIVHHNKDLTSDVIEQLENAIRIVDTKVMKPDIIIEVIT